LPEDIFLLISRITPLINVDLLIKSEQGQTLLTWRDDGYYPPSWHIPGGIIRYKETMADRIHAVALKELGADVKFKNNPMCINEVIHPSRRNRGHFISVLFKCTLIGSPNKKNRYKKGIPNPGEWAWHGRCPRDLIPVHAMYRKFISIGKKDKRSTFGRH
jgi:ADP-ribose pyrophosphatase YjhB (NUDIX family)